MSRPSRTGWTPWSAALVLALVLLAAPAAPATAVAPGWEREDLSTGTYVWWYVPYSLRDSLDAGTPAPVVLFFHGAGGRPEGYRFLVQAAAEAAGVVAVLPKSSDIGWGTAADRLAVTESLAKVRAVLPVDERRVAVAGHSAGGAYAYLLAYLEVSRFSGVFALAAPFYEVAAVADPAYTAPLRMYYGTTDPNFTGGAAGRLREQWRRLGVPFEEDVQAGYGHSSWPDSSLAEGFRFLARQIYSGALPGTCAPGPETLCLHGGRFRVGVTWTDPRGASGTGRTVACNSDGSGLFWFFEPSNWELMVKVIDGCGLNGRFWVFAAATTDVGYRLTVEDTRTGEKAVYENPVGRRSPAITDTGALAVCE
jgi:acetyl esterase/lipase